MAKLSHLSVHLHVGVDLLFLVATVRAIPEPERAVARPATYPDSAPQKVVDPADDIPAAIRTAGQQREDLVAQTGRHPLVGVDHHPPPVRRLGYRPVLLRRGV